MEICHDRGGFHTVLYDKRDALRLKGKMDEVRRFPHPDSQLSEQCKYACITTFMHRAHRVCTRRKAFIREVAKRAKEMSRAGQTKKSSSRHGYHHIDVHEHRLDSGPNAANYGKKRCAHHVKKWRKTCVAATAESMTVVKKKKMMMTTPKDAGYRVLYVWSYEYAQTTKANPRPLAEVIHEF